MATKVKKYGDGGKTGAKKSAKKPTTSSSAPKPKKESYTPFQNYLKNNPGAFASDTTGTNSYGNVSDVRTGKDDLDNAYAATYYAGSNYKRRTGNDEVRYDADGNRIKKTGGAMKTKMKTGGMVNANANLKATKSAGSKGVKSGVNPKAAASKTAKKPSAARSKAPKKAVPGKN